MATLEAGDYFGENALLRDETRMATVMAESALSTYKIKRDKFREPLVCAARGLAQHAGGWVGSM